jgi:phosphohistidine phosphatase
LPSTTKHFWLIRHAKSSWAEAHQDDFDRPLNARGVHDGERMADWLAEQTQRVDWLISSPAARAQATARFVRHGFGVSADAFILDESLYLAAPETILACLHSTPAEARCVAIVAHNPGMTQLVNMLASESQPLGNLPTFGSALFSCATSDWRNIGRTRCVLQLLKAPKSLRDIID